MALTEGDLIEVVVKQSAFQQQVLNVWQYEITGTFTGITAGAVANAYWQAVKATYRAVIADAYVPFFEAIAVRQLNDPLGDYGEYSIPSGERGGTRSTGTTDLAPVFLATGVRMTVDTRVTRPGQKRFSGLMDSDVTNGVVGSGVLTAIDALMAVAGVGTLTLGSPALGMDLLPIVVRKDPTTGLPTAYQEVTGYTINIQATTQNTRKIGRGV